MDLSAKSSRNNGSIAVIVMLVSSCTHPVKNTVAMVVRGILRSLKKLNTSSSPDRHLSLNLNNKHGRTNDASRDILYRTGESFNRD